MSARVSLIRRDALDVLAVLRGEPVTQWRREALRGIVRDALSPKPKKAAAAKAKRAKVAKRRASKAEETAEIRRACFERSGGWCEACIASGCIVDVCATRVTWESGELDHWFGRVKVKQAVSNCWFLCPTCHHGKTKSRNEEFWLTAWISHCRKHGYLRELRMAEARLDSLALSRESAEVGRAAR